MPTYALIFGKNPDLAWGEFGHFTRRFGLRIELIERPRMWVAFRASEDVERFFPRLGSSLKLVRLVGEGTEAVKNIEYAKLFTVSLYGPSSWVLWRKLGSEVKRIFKSVGPSKFFKPARVYSMPSELALKGFPKVKDIVFLFRKGKDPLVGETIRIVDPFELKKLDVGRPYHDGKIGIPLRLARTLLNLGEVIEGPVLDPFCGLGTIVMEALLQGFSVFGCDIDSTRILRARENIKWLMRNFDINGSFKLRVCDARELTRFLGKGKRFEAVISEPYMGEPLRRKPSRPEALRIARLLDKIYRGVLLEVFSVTDRGVFVFPAFNTTEGIYRPRRKWLRKIGLEVKERYLDYERRHRIIRDIHVMEVVS